MAVEVFSTQNILFDKNNNGNQDQFFTLCLKIFFALPNSEGPDEMQHYVAFHLVLHCLQKYSFRDFSEYKGLIFLIYLYHYQ